MHEQVSSSEAVLRGSMPNLAEIFRASSPTVIIATVLFAVQRFTILTSAAMLNCAPRE